MFVYLADKEVASVPCIVPGFAGSGSFGSLHYPINGMLGGEGGSETPHLIELLLMPQVIS